MNSDLLDKLQCPVSGSRLMLIGNFLVSSDSLYPYRYKIEGHIPDLLKEHAELMTATEYNAMMEKSADNAR